MQLLQVCEFDGQQLSASRCISTRNRENAGCAEFKNLDNDSVQMRVCDSSISQKFPCLFLELV
jgi:hypothetical protein